MSKGIEILDVHEFLLRLKDDAALKALFPGGDVLMNADLAAREPPPFYVVFSVPSDEDVNNMGGERIMTKPDYMVQAVGRNVGLEILRPIMERIDAVVTDLDGGWVVNNTYIGRFVRTNVIARADTLNNVRWQYLACLYKLVAYSMPEGD